MDFDQLSLWLSVSALVLGLFTVGVVGSQTREDARSIRFWTLAVLIPMLWLCGARLEASRHGDGGEGGVGLVVLCTCLFAAVEAGYRIAVARDQAARHRQTGKTPKHPFLDDELA